MQASIRRRLRNSQVCWNLVVIRRCASDMLDKRREPLDCVISRWGQREEVAVMIVLRAAHSDGEAVSQLIMPDGVVSKGQVLIYD